jgi:enoyl-CoA hydratase/carnithine racemase
VSAQSGKTDYVRYAVSDHVATVTLNRPERRNALGGDLSQQLIDTLDRAEKDPDVRVIILTAEGSTFCAGADMTPGDPGRYGPLPRGMLAHRTYTENGFSRFKPVVGAVRGYALGAGFFLAIRGCDIVVASDNALFGFPEARGGVAIGPVEYTPVMPFKRMLEFLLLGWRGAELMTAERAFELGIISKVVSDDQLMSEAMRYAALLQRIPPLYIKAVKAGMYRSVERSTTKGERDFMEYIYPQQMSGAVEESLAAFAEKREPKFR